LPRSNQRFLLRLFLRVYWCVMSNQHQRMCFQSLSSTSVLSFVLFLSVVLFFVCFILLVLYVSSLFSFFLFFLLRTVRPVWTALLLSLVLVFLAILVHFVKPTSMNVLLPLVNEEGAAQTVSMGFSVLVP
jgi:hypothetical protein